MSHAKTSPNLKFVKRRRCLLISVSPVHRLYSWYMQPVDTKLTCRWQHCASVCQWDEPTSALASRTTETPLSSSWLTQSFFSVFLLSSRAPFQRNSSYLCKMQHTSVLVDNYHFIDFWADFCTLYIQCQWTKVCYNFNINATHSCINCIITYIHHGLYGSTSCYISHWP